MAENKIITLADDEKLSVKMEITQVIGTDDYNLLLNIPKINGVEVNGEKSLDDYDIKKKSEADAQHTAISKSISAEINRAENAEKANSYAISAETTRAQAAEKANSDAISNHTGSTSNPHGVTAKQINAFSLVPTDEIPANANLNDAKYLVPGVYRCISDSNAQTIANRPNGLVNAFVLKVYETICTTWKIQELTVYYTGTTFYRSLSSSEDYKTNWASIYSQGNKPTKTDVGLDKVDNTSDADKSVKNAQTVNGHTVNIDVPANAKFTDTNTTYSNATKTVAGLMSAADKTKLDNLSSNIGAITTAQIDSITNS